MDTLKFLILVIALLILALILTVSALLRISKQVRQFRLDLELDRARVEQWVNEILLMSSRLRTLGEESAAWATLVESHFAYLDDIEYKRRVRKELPKPLTPFVLRKQESEQPELNKDG